MKKALIGIIIVCIAAILYPVAALAVPDQFIGDTAIYGGQPSVLQPNVLIIIDDSGSMGDSVLGSTYDSSTIPNNEYPLTPYCPAGTNCNPTTVYNSSNGNTAVADVSSFAASCTYSTTRANGRYTSVTYNPQNSLMNTGQYNGYVLNTDGSCKYCTVTIQGTTYQNGLCSTTKVTYQLGNYINWVKGSAATSSIKMNVAKSVIGSLVQSTNGVRFGVMTYNYAQTFSGLGGTFLSYPVSGFNYVTTVKNMDNIFTGTTTNRTALVEAISSLSPQGSTPLGETLFEALSYFESAAPPWGATIGVTGGTYQSPIQYSCQKNYVIVITDGMANTDSSSLVPKYLNNEPSTASGARYDGGCNNTNWYTYTTCNNIENHCLAGVAQYMYTHDLLSRLPSTTQNNVITFTIGFGADSATQEAVDLLNLASDQNHGGGANLTSNHSGYYLAASAQALSTALTGIINTIYATNSSYVAPVVPVNPENKLQFGSRVYMGFFYPEQGSFWEGNLKKFALGCAPAGVDPGCNANATPPTPGNYGLLNVLDATGNLATYIDSNGDGIDDRDGTTLCSGCIDGSFRPTAESYWTTAANTPSSASMGAGVDGGTVERGGVGAVLQSRPYTISSVTDNIAGSVRNVYTYTNISTNLTDSTNQFLPSNSNITATLLGLPGSIITSGTTTDVKKLINYVNGFDVYSTATSTNASTSKRSWIMGDDLHSKPVVVSYATFSYSDEGNCARNKNIIYAGTNDGMLHAFNDCDGSEAWAFIPPALLPNLQYLTSSNHTYFVDSSPQVYTYLAQPNDAVTGISSANNDSVILIVGLRRGGGVTTEPGKGFYYALDVTDPANPKYMWTISNSTAGFSDMGEAWSEPKIGKVAVSSGTQTQIKVAAFIGGGYDNCNEDGRFGATQTFSGSCVGVLATEDSGIDTNGNPLTSTGAVAVSSFTTSNSYKGRGVYVVELATLPATNGNALDLTRTGNLIWSYTFTNNNLPPYSMLSEIAAVDLLGVGNVTRLYAGDSGGNMWRFDLSSTSTSDWNVTKIFSSNPGYTNGSADSSTGRKIFYRPAVVPDLNNTVIRLYFGTGDREHPLNRAVVDRIYALFDKGINTSGLVTGITTAVTEAKLVDVTADTIQASTTQSGVNAAEAQLNLASNATDTTTYGWYIRLDSGDMNPQVLCNGVPCPGEKLLSTVAVAAGGVYVTTYSPVTDATSTTNPCTGGNLGSSFLYALDYWSGAAIKNYDPSNDPTSSLYNFNKYAFTSSDWGGSKSQVLLRTDRKRKVGSGIPSSAVIVCAEGNTNCQWLVGCGGGICSDQASTGPGNIVSPVYWRQK